MFWNTDKVTSGISRSLSNDEFEVSVCENSWTWSFVIFSHTNKI